MKNIRDLKRIEAAIEAGTHREPGQKAKPEQALTYILTDRRFFHHANLKSAKAEKEFLQATLGKDLKILKVWNASRQNIENDFKLLRAELDNTAAWNPIHYAMDRVITGAGY